MESRGLATRLISGYAAHGHAPKHNRRAPGRPLTEPSRNKAFILPRRWKKLASTQQHKSNCKGNATPQQKAPTMVSYSFAGHFTARLWRFCAKSAGAGLVACPAPGQKHQRVCLGVGIMGQLRRIAFGRYGARVHIQENAVCANIEDACQLMRKQ